MMNKLNLKDWTWDGRKLNSPFTIIRRLAFYPIIKAFTLILVLFVGLGYGVDAAEDCWYQNNNIV